MHHRKDVLHAIVQLADKHLGLSFVLLVLGEINERGKMLNNITLLIANRTDEESGPEFDVILPAVTIFQTTIRIALKFVLDLRQRLRIRAVRDQEIDTLADHLFPVVSRRRRTGQGSSESCRLRLRHLSARWTCLSSQTTKLDPIFGSPELVGGIVSGADLAVLLCTNREEH